jgi:MFS family permease
VLVGPPRNRLVPACSTGGHDHQQEKTVPALPRALSPLRHAGFRWLATALVLSLTSTGLHLLAVVWQVIELGGGPAALSLVNTGMAVGMLLTTLLGGALADRVPQRPILIAVALLELIATSTVAGLSLVGLLQVWHLAVASLLIGLAQGLYYPAYSALVPALLPADDLLPANGLEGVLRPLLTQAVGPAVAGAIVAATSPGVALLVTAGAALGAPARRAVPVRSTPTCGEPRSLPR